MSQGFNAYREWLGLTGQSEIPSYYELLGLRSLEPDTAKIEAAYQQQSARLAAQLSGGQADVAQRLMGELAEARLTLLTPTAKSAYDTALANAAGPAVPTASSPSHAGQTAPAAPQPIAAYPTAPYAAQGQQPAAGYGYPGGYPVAAQAAGSVYPAQAYPGWQAQPAMPAPAAGTAPSYYPTAAVPMAAVPQPAVEAPAIPNIRRRHVRRRSSPVPAVVGVMAVLAILGGTWLYFSGEQTVAVVDANHSPASSGQSTGPGPATRSDHKGQSQHIANVRSETKPDSEQPNVQSPSGMALETGEQRPAIPARDGDNASMTKPDSVQPGNLNSKPVPAKPAPDKPNGQPAVEMPANERPATDKPDPEKSKEEPLEAKAAPEEAAEVRAFLKAARAALANREITKAQDLLAEATIEATAPETTAEVGRVELLASYVEMFWDAARQTLPKIGLEELEINGTMMAVVEADENHLIFRAEGKNYNYKWQKLPRSIAYYLANRWLAPDDPIRNLVLASFEIVEPKGDRNKAESLLHAAAAAGLKSDSLMEELKVARGK